MRSRVALAVLLVGACAPVWSQTPGYVVQVNGDTLRGQIATVPDVVAGQRVEIVPDRETGARTYAASEARAYGDDQGRRYVSRRVPTEFEGESSAYFLQAIVEGPLALYALQVSSSTERYYVGPPDGDLEGLFVTRRPSPTRPSTVEVRNVYQAALARATFGCPDVQARSAQVDLGRRALARFVGDYNECVGADRGALEASATRRRSDVRFSVMPAVGLGVGYLSRTGETVDNVANPFPGFQATPQVLAPSVGVTLQVELVQVSVGSSLTLGLAYQRKSETPDGFTLPLGGVYSRQRADDVFGTNFLVVTYGYRLTSKRSGLAPYLSVGLVNGFVLDPKTPAGLFVPPGPKTESGLYLDVGATAAGFTLGGRVERTALFEIFPFPVFRSENVYRNTTFAVTFGRRFVLSGRP